jgi:rRNA maturation endonuclease Nob1
MKEKTARGRMKPKKEVYLECPSCRREYPLHEEKEGKSVIKQTCDECGGGLRRRVRK